MSEERAKRREEKRDLAVGVFDLHVLVVAFSLVFNVNIQPLLLVFHSI